VLQLHSAPPNDREQRPIGPNLSATKQRLARAREAPLCFVCPPRGKANNLFASRFHSIESSSISDQLAPLQMSQQRPGVAREEPEEVEKSAEKPPKLTCLPQPHTVSRPPSNGLTKRNRKAGVSVQLGVQMGPSQRLGSHTHRKTHADGRPFRHALGVSINHLGGFSSLERCKKGARSAQKQPKSLSNVLDHLNAAACLSESSALASLRPSLSQRLKWGAKLAKLKRVEQLFVAQSNCVSGLHWPPLAAGH